MSAPNCKKHLIVTIHGVRTNADSLWQDRLQKVMQDLGNDNHGGSDVTVVNFKYDQILAIGGWARALARKFRNKIPFLRNAQTGWVKRFARKLRQLRELYPDHIISIIAHSNGTHIAYNTLAKNPDIRVRALILIAGVISSHVEKTRIPAMLNAQQINHIVAWSSWHDGVVCRLLGEFVYGKVGCRGFVRYEDKSDDNSYPVPKFRPYDYKVFNEITASTEGRSIEFHSHVIEDPRYISEFYDWIVNFELLVPHKEARHGVR